MVNRPVPVTTPAWRTPIVRAGSHSVISMWSVSRSGPTLVSQTKRVPTPRRCVVLEPDRLGVGHPLDVALDRLDRLPDLGRGRRRSGSRRRPGSRTADEAGVAPTLRSSWAENSGGTMLMSTPVPRSKPAIDDELGPDVDVPVEGPVVAVGRGVEHEVVRRRRRAAGAAARGRRARPGPTAARSAGRRVLQVGVVGAGDDEQLVGRPGPERADDHDAVVVVDDAGPVGRPRPRWWRTGCSRPRSGRRPAPRRGSRPARTACRAAGRGGGRATRRPRGRGSRWPGCSGCSGCERAPRRGRAGPP